MINRTTRVQAKQKKGEPITVILYGRVSTEIQEEEGTSLQTQIEDCEEYARVNGYVIVDTITEAHSGFELEQREGVMKAIARCKRGEADAIIFRTYDRLSRNRTHFTVISYEAAKYGYELLCVKENFSQDSLYESITREFMAIMAEVERHKIRERTAEGMAKRAKSGKLINGKKARYGYEYADEKRVNYKIKEKEAEIIKKIDMLYLEGYAQRDIASVLTSEGIPTPTGGKVWGRTSVCLILKCSEYHGVGYAYTTQIFIDENGVKRHRPTPMEERVKLPESVFPPIRTIETYKAIQERIKNANNAPLRGTGPKEVLLRGGFIRCSVCGRCMTAATEARTEKRYSVYRCTEAADSNHQNAHRTQIDAVIIERAVADYVVNLLKDLNVIKQALTEYIKSHSAQSSTESYEEVIRQLKAEQEELSNDLRNTRGNTRALLIEQMGKLDDEIEKLEQHKRHIMGEDGKWENIKREVEGVIEWLNTGNADFKKADFETKQDIMKALGIVAFISRGEKVPGKPRRSTYRIRVTLQTLDTTSLVNGRY